MTALYNQFIQNLKLNNFYSICYIGNSLKIDLDNIDLGNIDNLEIQYIKDLLFYLGIEIEKNIETIIDKNQRTEILCLWNNKNIGIIHLNYKIALNDAKLLGIFVNSKKFKIIYTGQMCATTIYKKINNFRIIPLQKKC